MKKHISAIVPVITLIFYCCTYSTELKRSLESVGSNRAELEAVFSHYRTTDPNPHKLWAAEDLIDNLPAHYSYAGTKIYDYYSYAVRILTDMLRNEAKIRMQCYDRPDFKDALNLYTIETTEIPDKITLIPFRSYRYRCYLSSNGSWGSIAGLSFYGNTKTRLNAGGIANPEANLSPRGDSNERLFIVSDNSEIEWW
jgi:hypothetical protein